VPVPVVTTELVLDAIKARLDLIVGGPDFNTNPTKAIGIPRDAVPEGAGERLYLINVGSETQFGAAAPSHAERATYQIWAISKDPRKALRLVRDVQKAIRSGFNAIQTAGATHGVALGDYTRDERPEQITGATVYALTVTADWSVDLTT
jgi:hypothetical protein